MPEIKRYHIYGEGFKYQREDVGGEFVKYADVVALLAENEYIAALKVYREFRDETKLNSPNFDAWLQRKEFSIETNNKKAHPVLTARI